MAYSHRSRRDEGTGLYRVRKKICLYIFSHVDLLTGLLPTVHDVETPACVESEKGFVLHSYCHEGLWHTVADCSR